MPDKTRLLVAEDEGLVALSMEMFLTDMGYDVCGIAKSAPEAVRLAEAHHPDLALMDVRLAGDTDGLAAAREMRQRFAVPSILLTGASGLDSAVAREAGALGVLRKPYEPEQLARMIRAALQVARGEALEEPVPHGLMPPASQR